MRSKLTLAVIAISLLTASLPATGEQSASAVINAALCDVVEHPSRFTGRLVRVRVQDALTSFGNTVLVEPLSPTFKINLAAKPCTAGVDFHGPIPRGWLPPTAMSVFEGPISRFQPPVSYGPIVTVVAMVERSSKLQPKPRIVRNSEGKVIETNFWDTGPAIPGPEVRLLIKHLVDE
jgi:hypothetical protein